MTDTTWYEHMAVAIKKRDNAMAAIVRWQRALVVAEEEIQKLAAEQAASEPVLQEPVLETMEVPQA